MAESNWHKKYPEPWEYLYRIGKQAGLLDGHARLFADHAVATGLRPKTIGEARNAWSDALTSDWYDTAREWQRNGQPDSDPELVEEAPEPVTSSTAPADAIGSAGDPRAELVQPETLLAQQTPETLPDSLVQAAQLDPTSYAAAVVNAVQTETDLPEDMPVFDEAALESWLNLDKNYGVPQGYKARVRQPDGSYIEVEPQYEPESDAWNLFQAKSWAEIVEIQARLVRTGGLDITTLENSWGTWTPDAALAMSQILLWANYQGRDWDSQLDHQVEAADIVTSPQTGDTSAFAELTYTPMDYATTAQYVKDEVEAFTGRKPKDWEMALLAQEMAANHRASFEAKETVRRQDYDAQQEAAGLDSGGDISPLDLIPNRDILGMLPVFGSIFREGEGAQSASDVISAGPDVAQIDPLARLRQSVEARFGREVEETEAVDNRREQLQSFLGTILKHRPGGAR